MKRKLLVNYIINHWSGLHISCRLGFSRLYSATP
jgi:hypothetical protein